MRPVAIVVVFGLVPAIAGIPSGPATSAGGPAIAHLVGPVANGLVAVAESVVLWVVYTASFYGMATWLFDGRGAIRALLDRVGWGFAGLVVASVALASNSLLLALAPTTGALDSLQSVWPVVSVHVAAAAFLYSIVHWTYSVVTTMRVGVVEGSVSVVAPVAVSMGVFALVAFV